MVMREQMTEGGESRGSRGGMNRRADSSVITTSAKNSRLMSGQLSEASERTAEIREEWEWACRGQRGDLDVCVCVCVSRSHTVAAKSRNKGFSQNKQAASRPLRQALLCPPARNILPGSCTSEVSGFQTFSRPHFQTSQ